MGAGSTFSQGATADTVNPYAGATNPYLQAANAQAQGNLAGAQTATQANRVNQNTLYGGLNYQQGTDANGNPTWTANQTGTDQTQGLVNSSLAGLQASINNPAYGINPGQTYSDAIMQRLAPQMAQSAESNKAALANQGIVPGTQAYDNAMRTFNQGQNDLLTSAQMQGANLQNQLFNQNVTAGQFGNTALQNQNSMNLSNTQLGNQAGQQNYTNQLAGLGLNNQYAQQGYSNAVTGQQANNAALQNNYSQNLAAYNNPLQQLGAFQSGTQPSYINAPTQAAVAGPDYMGAVGSQTAAQIASNNAALGQQTANTQGLYGLGSAGILGLAANPGVISSIGSGLSSLGTSLFG